MKRKVVAFVSAVLMLMLLVIPAHAAPNTNRGYELDNTGYDGLHAIVSTMVGTGSPPAFAFSLKSPDVYQKWASAQIHPKNSCVQPEIVHERLVGSSTTTHKLIVTNQCTNATGYGYTGDLTDSTFRSNYVRTNSYNDTGYAFQDEVLELRVIQTYAPTNQWSLYLYNFNTSTYDLKAQLAGTVAYGVGFVDIGDGGYTQDSVMSCPTLYPWGIMQIRAIQKRVSGSWSSISAGDITYNLADSWPCISTNNYQERTSIPYQFKIEPYGVSY